MSYNTYLQLTLCNALYHTHTIGHHTPCTIHHALGGEQYQVWRCNRESGCVGTRVHQYLSVTELCEGQGLYVYVHGAFTSTYIHKYIYIYTCTYTYSS
ncbi:hypothetical protein EON63_09035 [archaeon]|nr:MAG: hypothetical protein EON63_09035 [archaeon]